MNDEYRSYTIAEWERALKNLPKKIKRGVLFPATTEKWEYPNPLRRCSTCGYYKPLHKRSGECKAHPICIENTKSGKFRLIYPIVQKYDACGLYVLAEKFKKEL